MSRSCTLLDRLRLMIDELHRQIQERDRHGKLHLLPGTQLLEKWQYKHFELQVQ